MDFDAQVARILEHIDHSPEIHEANKELIRQFHRDLLLRGISAARRQKLTSHLKIIARHLGQSRFDEVDREDIVELVEWIHSRGSAPSTVSDYKQVLKQFYRWNNGGEEPDETKWIRRGPTPRGQTLPQKLFSPTDVSQLIDACCNDRDRAFIALLWETGARIGELIDLRVGDIEADDSGTHVVVIGKTGARRLPLVESRPYLEQWVQTHPSPTSNSPPLVQTRAGDTRRTARLQLHSIATPRAGSRARRVRQAGEPTPFQTQSGDPPCELAHRSPTL
ncbi:tyrosine-type recombinase/integrase [Salinigranum halophilum]|uniref:tyrosine-type recombinase/integrase n=1 Tax=Salinigranum halophilum TaxID=2565931 RepID=UPI003742C6C2